MRRIKARLFMSTVDRAERHPRLAPLASATGFILRETF